MASKSLFAVGLLTFSFAGCCCMPNPACCGPGPQLLPPALTPPLQYMLPTAAPVYCPVSMTGGSMPTPPRVVRQRTRFTQSLRRPYVPRAPRLRYIPVQRDRYSIRESFKDRIVWGKPKWTKENKYTGVVQDKPRCRKSCQCSGCQSGRRSDCKACITGECGEESYVNAEGCGEDHAWYPPPIPYDEGCNSLEAHAVDVSDSKFGDSDNRVFEPPTTQRADRIPPPAPIPPPIETGGDAADEADDTPIPIEPPPVDMSDPDAAISGQESGSDIQTMSLQVPYDVEHSAHGSGTERSEEFETSTMSPISVTRRRIE